MPISITYPPGQLDPVAPNPPILGPGLTAILQSDFIGPFPSDAQWNYEVDLQPDLIGRVYLFQRPCTGPITTIDMLATNQWTVTRGPDFATQGRTVELDARIITSSGTIDSGHATVRWETQIGLGQQAYLLSTIESQGQGGFTAEDRQLLIDTEARTTLLGEPGELVSMQASGPVPMTLASLFSINSLDRLFLEEMTNGETCDPVRINLAPILQYAIVVRVTTIPDDIQFRTPDGEWSFPDLAVLRIFRGEDLVFRRGIHTPTFETEAPWEWASNPLNKNLFGIPPPATRVWVDWRSGCCGQVFIRHTP